ncbi:hypothetical protein G4B88_004600 [Cannabis sativa]|uniref:non-specific serine/threonine protein kinase n=1 Tax=Cannabis sativa TaxID=3483 RepID=A0A7J6G4S9_CANSA|nr:hypothetical protein G4B88_004600 [Cannabis sativa]
MVVAASFYVFTLYKKDREQKLRIREFLKDYFALKPSRYTYSDIKKFTNNFKNKLGEGAYGTVFKGKLSNKVMVAVKILNDTSKGNDGEEFLNEVATIGQIHHVNVVRLVGYCAEGFKRALVYEFLPNGSLHNYISLEASESEHQYSTLWLNSLDEKEQKRGREDKIQRERSERLKQPSKNQELMMHLWFEGEYLGEATQNSEETQGQIQDRNQDLEKQGNVIIVAKLDI